MTPQFRQGREYLQKSASPGDEHAGCDGHGGHGDDGDRGGHDKYGGHGGDGDRGGNDGCNGQAF